ncbi:helix-turn-helix domain-containing protein [Paenibacillus alba]|uniref:response regulator transcription factor n=1 Tax=Paenibacillus alba TaxID=1197127 RepID=UPI00156788D5|nr:helix-turn-helix domain-containing protein [Paenibacillus alba]NQX67805.1 helix-turn-helix domain-containing protein [Paenibacillus alba]
MYKVMLVDDDYPVLELLSGAIDWAKLDMELVGLYENGAVAMEAAALDMPDIVVTDIGMPRMNGLELIRGLKDKHPAIRVAILSCHNEFHFAQQAMKLNVQEYMLKDTLNPEDLEKLLKQFKISLDEEYHSRERHNQLRHLVDRNREQHKETFLRATIHEPVLNEVSWMREAESFGFSLKGRTCLPVACYIDGQRLARQRFVSDDVLRFALNNIMEEVLSSEEREAVHFAYDVLRSFIFISAPGGIKTNPYDRALPLLAELQHAVEKTLKIKISFIIGKISAAPSEIKQELNGLLTANGQRFYMEPKAIEKWRIMAYSGQDLFAVYDEAVTALREMLIESNPGMVQPMVEKWMSYLRENRFPPETVRDWILKLVLDLKLKLKSMQLFRNHFSVEILHKELLEMDTLQEMGEWMIHFFSSFFLVAEDVKVLSKRPEVLDACQYVSLHLNKKISLDEVSEQLFLNPSYFSRLFKKETGETFIEYVNRMKVERAKELLDQTNLAVSKIGESLGYDNHSYFIKMFKSVAGMTPLEYRGLAETTRQP